MKRSGPPKRRVRLNRKPTKIRSLRPGEPLPEGEPRRYKNGAGYVRLRWKVGADEYVEVYEHRLVAGLPTAEVHHRDGNKANNDPANLAPLSRREHATHHGEQAAANSKRVTQWNGYRSQEAYEKAQRAAQRREERKRFLAEIAELYNAGLSTVEIGERTGRHAGTISIGLRAAGVVSRRAAGRNTDITNAVRQMVHARAQMRCERCGRNLAWSPRQVHHRRPRQMGGSRHPETNLPANLLLLCVDCHQWIESHRLQAVEAGFLLSAQAVPSKRRINHAEHGWVLLTDDCRVIPVND